MSKIYVPLPSKEAIDLYLEQNFDGFIVGIEGFSNNFNNYYKLEDLDEIIDISKEFNKDIYVALNRLYYNDEIEKLKELVKILIKYDITGIGYTDNGLLNILNELNYDKDILWLSNHLGTNSKTINFLEKRNVDLALLSTEITIDEIVSIKKNTNIKIGTCLYGFLNMATSSRKLLTNYFEFIDKDKKNKEYVMKDKVKNKEYRLVEERDTNFFTNSVLNGISFYPTLIENSIDFIYLDDYMLDESKFYNIIEAFSSLRNAYDDKEYVSKLEEVVNSNTDYDTFYGFLDKKTVVKVKDYE